MAEKPIRNIMTKRDLVELVRRYELCVLSTVNGRGRPQSAVVGFSENEDLELVIGTSLESRKVANIRQNPNVAVVIGWGDNVTVQYEGVARVLEADELAPYQAQHFAKLPESERYKDLPDERYILIKPKWLRYTDCNQDPWLVHEMTFG